MLVTSCAICNYFPNGSNSKELESHHIHFQKNCLEDGKTSRKNPTCQKKKMYNLVVLCRKCHEKVHNGELIIEGYTDTSIGPLLNYKTNINKKISNGLKN